MHPSRSTSRIVLLTGATGFVGKVVLAELLRRRHDLGIAHVYVLIRSKRDKAPEARFRDEIAASPLFDGFDFDWTSMVSPVAGDLARQQAGLSESDRDLLQGRVTQIVHCAASVEFDLPIHRAASANITSALRMLEVAQGCSHLERMVVVSTAYVTPNRPKQGPVPEQLVELPFSPEAVYEDILAGRADAEALMKASGHPNTYTLTKCLAEHLVWARRGDVPLSIVRPSIVSATLRHPFPGWLDSPAAYAGFVKLMGSGQMRVLVGDPKVGLDVVPCDVVADCILDEMIQEDAATRIRHATVGPERTISVRMTVDGITAFFSKHPVDRRPRVYWVGSPGLVTNAFDRLFHAFPARLKADALQRKGWADLARLVKRADEKTRYVNHSFRYFTHHAFDFATAHPVEMPGFDARSYAELICSGVYRHLYRNDPTQASIAGRQHRDASRTDLGWVLGRPHGNAAIRLFGLVIRAAARIATDRVTLDLPSFERGRAQVPAGSRIVLVPSHRSYFDFLLASFLFFARPDLGIRIPYIAAAAEFAAIPILGGLFTKAQAFYLRRGLRREDPELTRRVHELVERGEVIEFFIEGARSRSRQFLTPRTGLLRCLQGTNRSFAILPISISYDRVPEEAMLERELSGAPKPRMRLRGFLRWTGKLLRGEVALGRVHIACASPVMLTPGAEVHAVAGQVMRGLQESMAVSTHHLRCFLQHAAARDLDLAWLRAALEKRGATVIESELGGESDVSAVTEVSLRQQWLAWFYPDALRRWPDHPVLRHEAAARSWLAPTEVEETDPKLDMLLDALFGPMLEDASMVLERLGDPHWAPRYATPAALLPDAPWVHLLHVQAVFDALIAEHVLVRDPATGLVAWGPEAQKLDAIRRKCHLEALEAAIQPPIEARGVPLSVAAS